jgi:hypothetical protein
MAAELLSIPISIWPGSTRAAHAVWRMGRDLRMGRIGRAGAVRSTPYGAASEAEAARDRQLAKWSKV